MPRLSQDDRKALILKVAAAHFAAKGFAATTTKAIADAMGVSETLIFKYFPTKRALYEGILVEKSPVPDLLPRIEEAARSRDDVQVFTLIAMAVIRGADPDLPRLLLFSALERQALSQLFVQQHVQRVLMFLTRYIRRRIADGAFRAVDPLLATRAFHGMVTHHRLLSEVFNLPVRHSADTVIEAYVDLFLAAVRSPAAAPRRDAGRRPAHRSA